MTAMRGVDAAFLAMERTNEPRHLGSLMIFDPSADGPLDRAAVHAALEARLPVMHSAHLAIAPSTTGLTRPSWRTVDRIDLDVHLRHTTLRAGDDPRQALDETVARLHAARLDRDRPLVAAPRHRRAAGRANGGVRQGPHGRARRRHRRRR